VAEIAVLDAGVEKDELPEVGEDAGPVEKIANLGPQTSRFAVLPFLTSTSQKWVSKRCPLANYVIRCISPLYNQNTCIYYLKDRFAIFYFPLALQSRRPPLGCLAGAPFRPPGRGWLPGCQSWLAWLASGGCHRCLHGHALAGRRGQTLAGQRGLALGGERGQDHLDSQSLCGERGQDLLGSQSLVGRRGTGDDQSLAGQRGVRCSGTVRSDARRRRAVRNGGVWSNAGRQGVGRRGVGRSGGAAQGGAVAGRVTRNAVSSGAVHGVVSSGGAPASIAAANAPF
jgi:hypothetical protein